MVRSAYRYRCQTSAFFAILVVTAIATFSLIAPEPAGALVLKPTAPTRPAGVGVDGEILTYSYCSGDAVHAVDRIELPTSYDGYGPCSDSVGTYLLEGAVKTHVSHAHARRNRPMGHDEASLLTENSYRALMARA